MKHESKLKGIFRQRCPRCHEGELFSEKNPYKLSKLFAMPHACSECGQVYVLEPSFFYGAMYVNYALTVAIGVAVFVAMTVLGDGWPLESYLIGITAALIVTAPFTFRLGRTIWIYMFVSYDPDAATRHKLEGVTTEDSKSPK